MSCLITNWDDDNSFINLSAKYILNGTFTANVDFSNQENQYTVSCGGLCRRIEITITQETDILCLDDEEVLPADIVACLAEDPPMWVSGVLTGFSEETPIEGVDTVGGTIVSYFDHLNRRAVNTERFYNTSLSEVIPKVLSLYAGIPSDLYSVDFEDFKILGPVNGNSTLAQIQLLAQAGLASMFVQVGGVLTIEKWKDHESPVEFVIPQEFVLDVKRASYNPKRDAIVRVRGAQVPKFDCGEVPFTDSKTGSDQGGYSNIPGKQGMCARSGIPTPCAKIKIFNLAGRKNDLLNARIAVSLGTVSKSSSKQIANGTLQTEVEMTSSWLSESCTEFNVMVSGRRRADGGEGLITDYQSPVASREKAAGNYWSGKAQEANLRYGVDGYPLPNNSFGSSYGASNVDTGNSDSYYKDQPSYSQVETLAIDENFSLCGNSMSEVSNPYVYETETLFQIAVRKFQETKMEENTWNVETGYIQCLKINQVVEFDVPEKEGIPKRTIKGVIAGIAIDHNPSEDATTMKLTISDLSCLGLTEYQSGNLINTTCGGADSSDINPWASAVVGLDASSGSEGDSIWVYSDGVPVILNLNQKLTIGDEYFIQFIYEYISGYNELEFAYPNDETGQTLLGSGIFFDSFTATTTSFSFQWGLPLIGVPGLYRISDLQLTKKITA